MTLPTWAATAARRLGDGLERLGERLRLLAGDAAPAGGAPTDEDAAPTGRLSHGDAGPPEHWLARIRQATEGTRVGAVARGRATPHAGRSGAGTGQTAGVHAREPTSVPSALGEVARSAPGSEIGTERALAAGPMAAWPAQPVPEAGRGQPRPVRVVRPAAPPAESAVPASGHSGASESGAAATAVRVRSPVGSAVTPRALPRAESATSPASEGPGATANAGTAGHRPRAPIASRSAADGEAAAPRGAAHPGWDGMVRWATSPPPSPPAPATAVRRHGSLNTDDADEARDELWPELPEWVRPSCRHDLTTLLRREDRRLRLTAEQTGSSWSAPPF